MNSNIKKLVDEMDGVSAVLQTNKAATEDMAAGSRDPPHSIESIASVRQENNTTVEEVGASAEEVSASAQTLVEMARGLQTIVAQFILAR